MSHQIIWIACALIGPLAQARLRQRAMPAENVSLIPQVLDAVRARTYYPV
jgi:hypothetical protein